MSTLLDIRQLVLMALARNDTDAVTLANAAINYALVMASLIFEPSEMYSSVQTILTAGQTYLRFPNLVIGVDADETEFLGLWEIDDDGALMPIAGSTINTKLLDIIKVFDNSASKKLDFIPFESWDNIVPASLTDLRYWTLFGMNMYFKASQTSNKNLLISYSMYPDTLVNDTDELPFNHHDQYIVATASGICQAVFEESDAAGMWAKIAGFVGDPSGLGTKARAIIEGQKTLLERAVRQTAQGGQE